MIYAHIFEACEQVYVWYRYPFKFNDASEEKLLEEKILATLSEETGDKALLDRQITEWKGAHGVEKIGGFEDFSGMSAPDDKALISDLRQEAHRMATFLDHERKEKLEWQKRCEDSLKEYKEIFRRETAGLVDLIKMQDQIMSVVEKEGCGCIDEARLKFQESIIWQ